MHSKTETHDRDLPSRRHALRRLACTTLAAYVVPQVLFVDVAYADEAKPSAPKPIEFHPQNEGDKGNHSSDDHEDRPEATGPSAVEPAASEEIQDGQERPDYETARESCATPPANRRDRISISRSDLARSQEAIQAGAARPLDEIWVNFTKSYDGQVLGVEFLGERSHTRYRFRAISATGRLETVTISAQTGSIEKIVGCG